MVILDLLKFVFVTIELLDLLSSGTEFDLYFQNALRRCFLVGRAWGEE